MYAPLGAKSHLECEIVPYLLASDHRVALAAAHGCIVIALISFRSAASCHILLLGKNSPWKRWGRSGGCLRILLRDGYLVHASRVNDGANLSLSVVQVRMQLAIDVPALLLSLGDCRGLRGLVLHSHGLAEARVLGKLLAHLLHASVELSGCSCNLSVICVAYRHGGGELAHAFDCFFEVHSLVPIVIRFMVYTAIIIPVT